MSKFKVTYRGSDGSIKTDTLQTTQANMDNLLKGDRFLTAEPIEDKPKEDKKLTAEFKGDANVAPKTFTGTKTEIEQQARKSGINPANLFYNGSNTAGVVPTKPSDVMDNNDISTIDLSKAPKELVNSGVLNGLSDEQKKIVTAQYLANKAISDTDKAQWLSALEQAKKLVEPFYAQQITIAQDEILRGFKNIEAANKMRLDLIQRNIDRINEDLSKNVDRLSIDQQSALSRLKESYQNTLVDLQNKVVDSGLAFSSKSGDLLSRAAREKRNIQTSTRRSFQRRIEDINRQSQRGIEDQLSNRQ